MRRRLGLIALFFAFGLAMSSAAGQAASQLQALSSIEAGLWDLRSTSGRDVGRSMCVTDPAVLLQLGHPGRACSRFPIVNQPKNADVDYSCAGAGRGQTTQSASLRRKGRPHRARHLEKNVGKVILSDVNTCKD